MDGIRATPMQNPILGLLADRLKRAQQFAVAPGGYANPPAEVLLNLLGVPAIQQTMERMAYGEPLTTGRGMTARVRPEVAEAAMTLLPAAAGTARVAERGAMAAGRAGERMAEKMVPQIMERGGMPAGLLEGMSSRTVSPLTVYHGSPAKFTKFDPTKIGSGEGAQAYGYGHYVAESPEVARGYQESLSGGAMKMLRSTFSDDPELWVAGQIYSKISKPDIKEGLQLLGYKGNTDELIKSAENRMKNELHAGSFYEIDLPDEQIAKMLDWDKPLSKQPENVQAALEKLGYKVDRADVDKYSDALLDALMTDAQTNLPKQPLDMAGEALYRKLGNPEQAAKRLREAGIPGIRYLDQGSRGAGEGTSNFVVFPGGEDLLTILKRNGGLLGP